MPTLNTVAVKPHKRRTQLADQFRKIGDLEQKIHFAIGSAAAAAAIFAPLSYKWKGILTGIAAEEILSAVYRRYPMSQLIGL
jgi:hypothetical protein